MELLQSQKNKLFDLIVGAGLSPLQFDVFWSADGTQLTEISYKNSRYYFKLYLVQTGRRVTFCPGKTTVKENVNYSGWVTLVSWFEIWLENLKRELSQPDKWTELLKSSEQIKWDNQEGENSQFSYQEVEGIYASVNQAKVKIAELGLVENHLRLIGAKLDYIAEKAKTLGKVDWKNLMMGTLITLVVELALKPETTNALWAIFKEAFQRIILISLR